VSIDFLSCSLILGNGFSAELIDLSSESEKPVKVFILGCSELGFTPSEEPILVTETDF